MKILGIGCSSFHDPSAALIIDGQVVAAAEEERFSRKKHAYGQNPVDAARFCLKQAGIKASEIDLVAFPWSPTVMRERRWDYARRAFGKDPAKAMRGLVKIERKLKKRLGDLNATLSELGLDPGAVEVELVEHHLAHASSAFHLSGFPSAAILTADGEGELTTTLMAEGLPDRSIKKINEIIKPDSLGLFYSTMTEYLGFRANNGEYKVMGMAPYGDPSKIDLEGMLRLTEAGFRADDERVWVKRSKRYEGKHFAQATVDALGPPRTGDGLSEPYTHVAAATQKVLEDIVIGLVERHLADALKRHDGRLAFAGGVALNVRLNRKLIEHPLIKELWVQPAAHDAGISLGAATYAAYGRGETIAPMGSVALGPSYTSAEVRAALDKVRIPYEVIEDPAATAADLLAQGEIVAWFQGRMEWGPRSLGQRSILGNPGVKGTSDQINSRIKFREHWRPFCPSVLAEKAGDLFDSSHDSPYMTFTFGVTPEWRERIPEVVHVDQSARPQLVTAAHSPRFHALLEAFHAKTGLPVLINTSLNRRGEPMVCSPEDAIAMFFGSGLEFMVIEDVLVRKRPATRPA